MYSNKTLPAFTLSELLVVLVIIGILILLALPSLMPLISRTRSIEAKQALKHVQMLQRTYYFEHSRYSKSLELIGFDQEGLVTGDKGNANYQIEISDANATTFRANATSKVDFDGDGVYNQWQIDEKGSLVEIVKD